MQQTFLPPFPRMQGMEAEQARQEENEEMIEMNINEFMQVARQYLFGLVPGTQPALAAIPLRQAR